MRIECCVCYEKTRDLGELDSCFHRFCFECISRWAETENRCPMCKERFIVIKRKRLPPGISGGGGSGGGTNASGSGLATGLKRSREEAVATDGARTDNVSDDDEDEDPDAGDGPRKRLKGTVVETRIVPDKKQVCSRGDDDEQLLLCDGCDRGFHTYCVEMDDIPQGEWYCPDCEQQRALLAATARGRRLGGARGGGRGRGVAAAAAATGSGRGWAARGRGRNGAATAAAAMAEESSSDSDSYGEVSGDAAAEAAAVAGHGGGRGGGSDVSGYDTIGSDAEDQEGPDVGWVGGSDDGEGGAEVDYDHDDTNEDGIGSGGQDDEDQEEDAGEQGGVYGPTAGSRGGGGARRRARSRSAGRGRSRGRGRGRRRQTSAARGRRRTGSRRGPTRAALRERLGTAAQSRARTAAQGPGSAAAAAAAAAAAGDLEEVPLAQRRTVARARLYADQLRVEMMRRNWEVRDWDNATCTCQRNETKDGPSVRYRCHRVVCLVCLLTLRAKGAPTDLSIKFHPFYHLYRKHQKSYFKMQFCRLLTPQTHISGSSPLSHSSSMTIRSQFLSIPYAVPPRRRNYGFRPVHPGSRIPQVAAGAGGSGSGRRCWRQHICRGGGKGAGAASSAGTARAGGSGCSSSGT
ncbi:hypothetical protein Vafri_15786 [Volvox africanus]|uniref:PHD and RING finger domain-containing protein 1 n=1 Tax=Volvox africanus TaxID=51714 RepID=A0A8J4BGU9_9CHLO|nr:hypothetical protein Vafri_15786 [Volvox africanus]